MIIRYTIYILLLIIISASSLIALYSFYPIDDIEFIWFIEIATVFIFYPSLYIFSIGVIGHFILGYIRNVTIKIVLFTFVLLATFVFSLQFLFGLPLKLKIIAIIPSMSIGFLFIFILNFIKKWVKEKTFI